MKAGGLFINATQRREASAGEVIYQEGDSGDHMYGVVSGRVELRKGSIVVAVLGPNDVFGERALIDNQPRNLTAVAKVDSVLAEIDRSMFLFLIHETATFALDIMGALATRLKDYDDMVGALAEASNGAGEVVVGR